MQPISFYDPAKVTITADGNPLSGFADGDFINISFDENLVNKSTGADGMTQFVKVNNKGALVTVTLQAGSASNEIMSSLANEGKFFEFYAEDTSSTGTKFTSPYATIQKQPDIGKGKDAATVAWLIDCANATLSVAGNVTDDSTTTSG